MSNFRQLCLGGPVPMSMNAVSYTSYTWVNTTDQVEWIVQVPDDAGAATVTITQLGYRLTSVTGVSPVMKISIQGVDASGNPDGVIKGGASPASATFTPSGTGTWNWVTLDNAYTANRGDFIAIVIAYSSGTLNGSNTPVIAHSFLGGAAEAAPYAIQNVAGTRTRQVQRALFGFRSSTKAFGLPVATITGTAFSSANERAMRFFFDQSLVSTYKVAGIRYLGITPAAAKTEKLMLYSGTTVIATATIDSDAYRQAAVSAVQTFWFQDATLPTLSGGVEYRVSLAPQDAATNIAWYTFDVNQASDMDAFPGGQQWYLSTRSGGAWTDTLTSRPIAELIVSDWTAPSRGVVG